MNRYKKLLGTSRGGRFREPKRRSSSSSARRQTVRFRTRYAKSVAHKWGNVMWSGAKVIFAVGVLGWGAAFLYQWGRQSTALRVQQLIYRGDTSGDLQAFVPIKSGQSLLSIHPSQVQAEIAGKFPEFKTVSVRRTLGRNVIVETKWRVPIALSFDHEKTSGVDSEGILFRLDPLAPAEGKLPTIESASQNDRRKMVSLLEEWKADEPEFYSLIEHLAIKNDALHLTLRGGIELDWGLIDEKKTIVKSKNILRLMSQFTPSKATGKLSFVTDDRIVMDGHWEGK